jgi:hypothetical protein
MSEDSKSSKKGSTKDSQEEFENFDFLGDGKAKLADGLKKLFAAGVGGVLMGEEGIRSYLAEAKLPKEILNVVLASANKSKDEITNKVSKEMIAILSKIDFVKEASRFMEDHKFKVTAEIEVLKKHKDSPSQKAE